ncbi:MAG: response regulator [Paludibacteraceae bacterium]|nr:response regulator [Paludibacteraceae bacterium]
MKAKNIIALTILTLFISHLSYAQYKIRHITADDGLSRNHVFHIFRDSHGFMWFSTAKGLDRFDGYDFIHFDSNTRENPLPNDVVHCVSEDSNGNLWIGTENGLFFYEYKSGEIQEAAAKIKSNSNVLKNNIRFISRDENDMLWVGHDAGLSVLSFDDQGVCVVMAAFESKTVEAITFNNGNIYVGDANDVFRLIKTNDQKFSRVATEDKLQNLAGDVNVLFIDRNFLWAGTGNGLYRYDMNTEEIRYYQYDASNNNSLSSATVTDIARSKDGCIMVATLIGLNIYDYNTDKFSCLTSAAYPSPNALSNNFMSCLLSDDEAMWAGTEKGGVNLLLPEQNFFNNIVHNESIPTSLSKNPVNAIFEDGDGDLWVGTVEGGLNIRTKGNNGFLHSVHQSENVQSLSHNSVSAITQDYNGDYWIATWGAGLNKLLNRDKFRPVFKRYVDSPAITGDISSNFVATVLSDQILSGLFVGTRSGLDFIDVNSDEIFPVLRQLPEYKAIKSVTGTFIDSKRRLWVGTGNGLFCIYLNRSDFRRQIVAYQHFHYKLTDPDSKEIEKISCILESRNHKMWFGSNGNGLYSFENVAGKGVFKKFDVRSGLTDNVLYGILEDETGTLWLSTDKGLCAFEPGKKSFRSFSTVDGLASNQFYWDAYYKGRDGKLYFGHVAGLTWFDPLKYIPQQSNNSVEITRISILNQFVFPARQSGTDNHLQFAGNKLVGMVLKESDRAFSVEFSSLNYFYPDKIKYAYRLKGFDNQWKEVGSERRFANFTNIGYGNYQLEIKCTNADGAWSDSVKTLHIKVIPPLYKTWWFVLLVVALLLYAIFSYYKYRINLLVRQEIHLRKQVDERTSEIEQQKEMLQDQALKLKENMNILLDHQAELSQKNDMLIRQNHEITRQKEELEELTRKVEEVTVDKISFFTNITHEFRTPITLILGPVERALKLSTNPKVLEQLDIVKRNSRLLLSLINQLMDFRKVDSERMKLTQTQQNFVDFLNEIILPFEDLVKDRGIVIRKQFRINPPEFLFDKDNMQKVLGNLLSNAIKFTPDRGQISIIASTYTDKADQQEKLYLAVKDSGKGILPDDLQRIFERFYQSKQNQFYSGYGQSGTGIGLYLCKRIIELHNGRIEAMNLHSGGACFRFIIPIERNVSTMFTFDGKPIEIGSAIKLESADEISSEISKAKPLVLIVEDNSDMRQYIRSIMINEYNVLEAPNGVVGLEITKRYQPDLIISDIMMPEMDGIELCDQLKSNFATSHIPIVLLTAKSATDTQIESFHKGADAFLLKPFDEDLLKAMIRSLTEKRKRIQMSFAENMDTEVLHFDDESLDKKFMDKALRIIRENYANPDFDVTEFIEMMGISRSLLHKKLTNLSGQSASRFIRIYRLNIARELIVKNRISHAMNISEIAYEVGFNDPKYFTRCFTKHFGIQPSVFMGENTDTGLNAEPTDDQED